MLSLFLLQNRQHVWVKDSLAVNEVGCDSIFLAHSLHPPCSLSPANKCILLVSSCLIHWCCRDPCYGRWWLMSMGAVSRSPAPQNRQGKSGQTGRGRGEGGRGERVDTRRAGRSIDRRRLPPMSHSSLIDVDSRITPSACYCSHRIGRRYWARHPSPQPPRRPRLIHSTPHDDTRPSTHERTTAATTTWLASRTHRRQVRSGGGRGRPKDDGTWPRR